MVNHATKSIRFIDPKESIKRLFVIKNYSLQVIMIAEPKSRHELIEKNIKEKEYTFSLLILFGSINNLINHSRKQNRTKIKE